MHIYVVTMTKPHCVLSKETSSEGKYRKRLREKRNNLQTKFDSFSLFLSLSHHFSLLSFHPIGISSDRANVKFPFMPCVSAWLTSFKTWTIYVRPIYFFAAVAPATTTAAATAAVDYLTGKKKKSVVREKSTSSVKSYACVHFGNALTKFLFCRQ